VSGSRVSKDVGEQGRRDLVANIALRGSQAYDTRDTSVQPSKDLQASFDKATARGPVDLNSAQQAALDSIAGAPTELASQFAEAQRKIFEDSRQRELAYGNQYYDATPGVVDSTNASLDRYQAQLEQQAQDRRNAAYRASSAVTPPVPEDSLTGYPVGQFPTEGAYPQDFMDPNQGDQYRASLPQEPIDITPPEGADMQAFSDANTVFNQQFLAGADMGTAQTAVYLYLTDAKGLTTHDARQYLAALQDGWSQRWHQDTRTGPNAGDSPADWQYPETAAQRRAAEREAQLARDRAFAAQPSW